MTDRSSGVLNALRRGRRTVPQIAGDTRYRVDEIELALERLVAAGLVEQVDGEWRSV